jgi:hypothetical protein
MSDATLLAAANTDDAGHGSADRQVDKTIDRRFEETIDRRVEETIDRQVEETTDRRRRLQRLLSDYPVLVMVAIGWIFAILAVALFADLLAPYGYSKLDLSARLAPPVFMGGSPAHWLGTDELGRDVLSRLVISVRISLLVAFVSTVLSATIGVSLGFIAAHFRGWVEQVVLTLVDFQASMPRIIIAGGARLLRQHPDAVHRPDGLLWLGTLGAHCARPDRRRQRAGLCRSRQRDRRIADARVCRPCAAQHRQHADRQRHADLSRSDSAGVGPVVPGAGRTAADDQPGQHGGRPEYRSRRLDLLAQRGIVLTRFRRARSAIGCATG